MCLIFLETPIADVFFALGYAHAQDRLWQMIMLRRNAFRAACPKSLGRQTLETDTLMRRLDLAGHARASVGVGAGHPKRLAALQGLCQRRECTRIDEINLECPWPRRAGTVLVSDRPFRPLGQPADSIGVQKLMALQMSQVIWNHEGHQGSHCHLPSIRSQTPWTIILPLTRPAPVSAALPEYAST